MVEHRSHVRACKYLLVLVAVVLVSCVGIRCQREGNDDDFDDAGFDDSGYNSPQSHDAEGSNQNPSNYSPANEEDLDDDDDVDETHLSPQVADHNGQVEDESRLDPVGGPQSLDSMDLAASNFPHSSLELAGQHDVRPLTRLR